MQSTRVSIAVISIITSIICLLQFAGCKSEEDLPKKMEVIVCGTKNPNWVREEVASISSKSSNYVPIRISVYKGRDAEIVCIEDMTNSNMVRNVRFFDCSGNRIEPKSSEYRTYFQYLVDGNFSLLWSN